MTELKEIKPIPEPTLRRLPQYLYFLKNLENQGVFEVSTTKIANEFKQDPTQIRKDLGYLGSLGKPKIGYEVTVLINAIETFLNWNNTTEAFIAGAGNLGMALIGYEHFAKYGIKIIAAFDNDPSKVGVEIKEIPILSINKLSDLIKRMHVNVGIITVPAETAQDIADMMIEGGIKAIWNFAPVILKVPEDIIIENAQFATSLAVLSRKLMVMNK
jgi:redox-sensing transcriptional repressor